MQDGNGTQIISLQSVGAFARTGWLVMISKPLVARSQHNRSRRALGSGFPGIGFQERPALNIYGIACSGIDFTWIDMEKSHPGD
jgi:hypothetical protein